MSRSETATIELCDACKGTGVIEIEVFVNNTHDYKNIVCNQCEGCGRLEVTVITEKIPYRPSSITIKN